MKKFYNISCILTQMPNGLIRKIILILKFMMSQPGLQRITIHILLNISRIKGNLSERKPIINQVKITLGLTKK